MRKITADVLYTGDGKKVFNGVVIIDDHGKVLSLSHANAFPPEELECYNGAIIPGLINTHCHLELSHMRGLLPVHTGLIPFIYGVLQKREAPKDVIYDAIEQCDREMYENGIVAVGDISNTDDSLPQKSRSKIRYHTFVEVFNINPAEAKATFDAGKSLYDKFTSAGLSASIAPHAPYTVSPELFRLIDAFNSRNQLITSMHNQETPDENLFFLKKQGALIDFYHQWGVDISHFKPTGKNSLPSVLPYMPETKKILLVHNTMTEGEDIDFAHGSPNEIWWNTNPNANLYIENRLPQYHLFIGRNARMTIGTDSIASNWQLSVLEEMKTISSRFPDIPFDTLLQWATINGAKFLGWDDEFGSITEGKTPGILLLKNFDVTGGRLLPETTVERLA